MEQDDKVPYNAGDEASVGKKKTKDQLQKEREDEQFRSILQTKMGRAWFWRLLTSCRILQNSFDAKYPELTPFNEGIRNVGLTHLKAAMELDLKLYNLMVMENFGDTNAR